MTSKCLREAISGTTPPKKRMCIVLRGDQIGAHRSTVGIAIKFQNGDAGFIARGFNS
jgi:hypothetical protein